MVAGYTGALANIARHGDEIREYVATTCPTGRFGSHPLLVIFTGLHSNVDNDLAADIAGPEWVDRHVGRWVFADGGRARAEERCRARGSRPPGWPFKILTGGHCGVWLAPFDGLPAHLTRLWEDATWLDGDHWQTHAPERPANSLPCVVHLAGHWRMWLPAPAPQRSFRLRDWFR
jgi:hypothetical protein